MKYHITLGLAMYVSFGHSVVAMEKIQHVLIGADKVAKETCQNDIQTKKGSVKEPWANLYYAFPGASSPVYSVQELDQLKNDSIQSSGAGHVPFASDRR